MRFKFKMARIHGYKDTSHKDTRIQGYKDTRIQGYKDTKVIITLLGSQ